MKKRLKESPFSLSIDSIISIRNPKTLEDCVFDLWTGIYWSLLKLFLITESEMYFTEWRRPQVDKTIKWAVSNNRKVQRPVSILREKNTACMGIRIQCARQLFISTFNFRRHQKAKRKNKHSTEFPNDFGHSHFISHNFSHKFISNS